MRTAHVVCALATAFAAGGAFAASNQATMTVSATVMARAMVTTQYQSSDLVITTADVARGYVDAPNATSIRVRTNSANGYLLTFEANQPLFTAVQVSGAGDQVSIAAGGGWVLEPFTATTVGMVLSYRFSLAPGVQPGSYAWPLEITARTP